MDPKIKQEWTSRASNDGIWAEGVSRGQNQDATDLEEPGVRRPQRLAKPVI